MTCLPCENCHGKKHTFETWEVKSCWSRGDLNVYIYIYICNTYTSPSVISLPNPSFWASCPQEMRCENGWSKQIFTSYSTSKLRKKKKNVVFLQSHVFVALIRSTYALISIVDLSLTGETTSRIIPVSKWLIPMVIVSLLVWVVGPLPNGRFMAYKRGLLTTSWDDPPSRWTSSRVFRRHHWVLGRNLLLPKIRRFKTPRLEEVGEDIHPPKY